MHYQEVIEKLRTTEDIVHLFSQLFYIAELNFPRVENILHDSKTYPSLFRTRSEEFKQIIEAYCDDSPYFDQRIDENLSKSLFKYEIYSEEEFILFAFMLLSLIDNYLGRYPDRIASILNEVYNPIQIDGFNGPVAYNLYTKPRNLILSSLRSSIHRQDLFKPRQIIDVSTPNDLLNFFIFLKRSPIKVKWIKINEYAESQIRRIGKKLRIGVSPIATDFSYRLMKRKKTDHGVPYNISISKIKNLKKAISKLLSFCVEEGINILILPELMVPQTLRIHISSWLAKNESRNLLLVVAGSFHTRRDDGTYVNDCIVYNHIGKIEWQQRKITRMEIPHDTADSLNSVDYLFNLREGEAAYENIEMSDEIVAVDSRLGRMVVTICKDFFSDKTSLLIQELCANVIFVPALSPGCASFEKATFDYSRRCSASIFCAANCWFTSAKMLEGARPLSSFYSTPMKGGKATIDYTKIDTPLILVFDLSVFDKRD